MKTEIKFTVFVIFLFIFATTTFKAQDALPTPRGAAAVEKLKQADQYDGLMETFRKTSERTDEPATENLFSQTAKLTAADPASLYNYGYSVAISGNTAIIGASEAAYIFVRSGTTWTQQQKLTVSDGGVNPLFGRSVAIDGDTAVVGANNADIGDTQYQGAAYVFVRSGNTWSQQQKLFDSNGTYAESFGFAVAINGNTIAASAETGRNDRTGTVHVFVRSGTVWTAQQKLVGSDVQRSFGSSLAVEGDTLVAGAPYHDQCGSAYVFVRTGTIWTERQKLNASDRLPNDTFGGLYGADISGDTIVIGARWSLGARGSAYVFVRSGTVWTEQQKLTAAEGAAGDFFSSVSISGDTIIVGAPDKDFLQDFGRGAAYLFVRSGAVWTERQRLIASDGAVHDYFGYAVAMDGNKIIVGAPFANGQNPNQGAAYSYVTVVSIGGRVMNAFGYGVSNTLVQMTTEAPVSRLFARTSSFGYYRFDNVEADQTVTISVSSKRYQFTSQMVDVNANLTNVDFIAQ